MSQLKKPRSRKKPDQTELIIELLQLVKDQMAGQNAVLTMAMESQKANADVLAKWMGMFTPTSTPNKSTTEEERAIIREQAEREAEWQALDFDPMQGLN